MKLGASTLLFKERPLRRDLLADIGQARTLGLHEPKYPPKTAA